MPEIRGVLETSLYVSDLERSRFFYTQLFHFPVDLDPWERRLAQDQIAVESRTPTVT